MIVKFELFGFCIDKDWDLKSFWIGSFTKCGMDDINDVNWNLFLTGKAQGKWMLELFGKWICGPRELFLRD